MSVHKSTLLVFFACLLCAGGDSTARETQAGAARQYFDKAFKYQSGEGGEADLDQAVRYYKKALEIDPGLFAAALNLGLIYSAQKKYKAAKHYFGEAVRIARREYAEHPEYEAPAANGLGVCYQKEKDLARARQWFEEAIRKDRTLAEAHYNLINLMLKEGHLQEARRALERAGKQAPSRRYEIIKGRIQGKEGEGRWAPLWLEVLGGALLLGIPLLFFFKWLHAK